MATTVKATAENTGRVKADTARVIGLAERRESAPEMV